MDEVPKSVNLIEIETTVQLENTTVLESMNYFWLILIVQLLCGRRKTIWNKIVKILVFIVLLFQKIHAARKYCGRDSFIAVTTVVLFPKF